MSCKNVAIIDYGMGNLHSVASAVQCVAPDVNVSIVGDPEKVKQADHVIFPGVGAIRDCVGEIKRLGFDQVVSEVMAEGTPLLGICVGMQSMMSFSEENQGVECLNLIPGNVRFFSDNETFKKANDESAPSGERLKVPHMGWNQVEQTQAHPLWKDIPQNSRFYFVHSYFVEIEQQELQAGKSHYGVDFTSVISKENMFAVQFHPEKSSTHGLQLIKNFIAWDGQKDS